MAGKISDADKNLKIGSKFNPNMVKISSSKSILSYQNGSASNIESRECTTDEVMPGDGYSEETSMSEEPSSEDQNLKSECLDILRKKLISDLSLTVFSSDLENKLAKMELIEISKERQTVIQKLVVQISQLSDAEKLLLYLKLPSSTSSPFDPLRQPLNPLGNRQEIQQTIVWIKTHLEEDSEISIPKQDVYDQYLTRVKTARVLLARINRESRVEEKFVKALNQVRKYCENVSMKPLSTADFGKVMKQVYPGVRPRRLGTRGNSRYCYSGMRNTCKLPTPILPQSSIDGPVTNGTAADGSSPSESSKYKKADKTKRKWKSAAGNRNEKGSPSGSETEANHHGRNAKRAKVEEKEADSNEAETGKERGEKARGKGGTAKEEADAGRVKCEESSDNSFGAFDVDCGLDGDFGIYFKSGEKADAERSGTTGTTETEEKKQGDHRKMPFHGGNFQKAAASGEQGKGGEPFAATNGEQHPEKANGLPAGSRRPASEQQKASKGRARRSASFSKAPKNQRKCYVPIQPKPVEVPQQSIRFEAALGIGQFALERKQEREGLSLCEESDSQEPEEEIVRYFKHLDENEINAGGFVDQAVKNIENSSVQISGMSQIISKDPAGYRGTEEALSQATQQILRSQSCFEVQRELFNLGENVESVYAPRSQSSVELPTSAEQTQQEGTDSDSGLNGKNKRISHLRILLEKSISSSSSSSSPGRSVYPGPKDGSPGMPAAQPAGSLGQGGPPAEAACLLAQGKPLDHDLLRLNGPKVVGKGPSFVPQSPSNRTKYFSFTPISPGPHSPLKTPSTPSASPFVSPRNTPVPRSRQNSSNDFFLSPSERKSAPLRADPGKSDFFHESVFNFSKSAIGKIKAEAGKHPGYLQEGRPRSYSSTNFCRSKARRNASKAAPYEQTPAAAAKTRVEAAAAAAQGSPLPGAPFSIHKNFVSSDSLSNEVRKFLENNSKAAEDQSATIRSQSVPLNRMISESTWMPAQVSSPIYSGYFGSGAATCPPGPLQGKFPDWGSNSETNSPKDVPANASPFLANGEMTNLEPGPLGGEVFSGDPTMAQLGEQYFPGEFQPGTEEAFSESDPFREESAFGNKLDLNSSGTFDSAFASDSDPAIADSIKSYLPDFEGLDGKSSGNGDAEGKLFKNVLYERGNDNLKDPVITSFKPVLAHDMPAACPGSPVLNFFGAKMNEDNQQLIEFFDFEN